MWHNAVVWQIVSCEFELKSLWKGPTRHALLLLDTAEKQNDLQVQHKLLTNQLISKNALLS